MLGLRLGLFAGAAERRWRQGAAELDEGAVREVLASASIPAALADLPTPRQAFQVQGKLPKLHDDLSR